MHSKNFQANLGRDGLTHYMLELIHTHWICRWVCRIKWKYVPIVDMHNVCYHMEDKTGRNTVTSVGGIVFLLCGLNYNWKNRPTFPLMHWKPATSLYLKLIERDLVVMKIEEVDAFQRKWHCLHPFVNYKKMVYTLILSKMLERLLKNAI